MQHIDLAPTLLELVGVPPATQFQGRSFAEAFRGGDVPPPVPVVTETSRRKVNRQAVREGDWKLIVDHRAGTAELYDLSVDPGEHDNLVEEHPDVAERLVRVLAETVRKPEGLVVNSEVGERDEAAEEALKALGYFGE